MCNTEISSSGLLRLVSVSSSLNDSSSAWCLIPPRSTAFNWYADKLFRQRVSFPGKSPMFHIHFTPSWSVLRKTRNSFEKLLEHQYCQRQKKALLLRSIVCAFGVVMQTRPIFNCFFSTVRLTLRNEISKLLVWGVCIDYMDALQASKSPVQGVSSILISLSLRGVISVSCSPSNFWNWPLLSILLESAATQVKHGATQEKRCTNLKCTGLPLRLCGVDFCAWCQSCALTL